jgi:predicted dehydrogenase
MSLLNRRQFAGTLSVGALAANDSVNLAVVGLGGRGRDHMNVFGALPGVRIGAICDVNQEARERAVAQVEKLQGHKPKVYADMRKLYDDKEVQAVSIATPNHWHALSTIWACQAGKDVYIEKPACHNPWEGAQMIAAAKKYGRLVQVGSQSRSLKFKIRAMELLRQGIIGKVHVAKGLCYKRRKSIGRTPDIAVPPGIDWDMFLGPAQLKPFSWNKFKYNWHWFWDTGNGDIGNQGVHEMDIARWGLGKESLPSTVISTGGKFCYDDDQETPNTQTAVFDYGDCQLVFEVRGLLTGGEDGVPSRGGHAIGNIFYGSDGYMGVDLEGFRVYKGEGHELVIEEKYGEKSMWDPSPHMANFVSAVRSRNAATLTAPVSAGVLSANLCHYANISYRTGRKLKIEASGAISGDSEANRLLTRNYRKPYEVPAF